MTLTIITTTFSIPHVHGLVTHILLLSHRKKMPSNGPSTLHRPPCSTHTSIRSIFLCFSYIFLSIFSPSFSFFSFHCLYATRYCNEHKEQNQKREKKKEKLCVATGRSPLQCPWVLSISGKQARPSADCRGCFVRYSRPRPRPVRSACLSVVTFCKATPYLRVNRQC